MEQITIDLGHDGFKPSRVSRLIDNQQKRRRLFTKRYGEPNETMEFLLQEGLNLRQLVWWHRTLQKNFSSKGLKNA
jgi:hypothetical protein